MQLVVKTYTELTLHELYSILQLRSEVFVVEQNCVYQDIDDKDQEALHVFFTKETTIVAYTRLFKPGFYFPNASIGRVIVKQQERAHGYGYQIMEASIAVVSEYFNTSTITISAQTYLVKFYTSLGFTTVGEEYLEDGIPHIEMFKS